MTAEVSSKPKVSYLDNLLRQAFNGAARVIPQDWGIAAPTAAWLQQVRDNAGTWVRELAMPTKKDEEWRFTDISPLLAVDFETAPTVELPKAAIAPFELPEVADSRLVFVNGVYAPHLSEVSGLPDSVFVGNLGQLTQGQRDRLPEYLAQVEGGKEIFTALNTAGLTDAAVVWVAKNAIVDTPIHLLFVSVKGEKAALVQPRTLVVAEGGSDCTLIEEYLVAGEEWCHAQGKQPYFTNAVTEFWLADNARVNHARIQREASDSFHIGKTAIAQGRDSQYTCTAVSTGAKLSRHNLEMFQKGEGTYTTLNGLTCAEGEQVADTHSALALNYPHGNSTQLHKCIIGDRAHTIFNGKIFVPKPAQMTDASQLNRNLLLSPKARVNTKPQLEITADNVKCAHGATVSQLEDDELFYLQSRGLDATTSRNLLIDGFAGEIIDHLPIKSLKTHLSRCIACRA
ncbi:Fe-S cluster assembly protein SufD [Phormidium sp. CCY1219]|uniref:Fe-S cluster assembly protein SufD n=1 Tax=Phormidium sp. CCY1219 TaxID=2886104 RepID=UPI002D1E5625|nr:Fe-S cluster assembly protein SufD [Phormidium sp. CCY1219]MEB3830042.1 Fe-S cluster assembly protein SufD [Phormidium sp. CCY1219]